MKPERNDRRVFLGMPGYGRQTSEAGMGFWRACADMKQVTNIYRGSSLLASNFNQLWCEALNRVHSGGRVDYFAMLHDDIGTEQVWLDKLIDELESHDFDLLGVAAPIKDRRGLTSIALGTLSDDNWAPDCRLSMHDLFSLPETFTSDDLGGKRLLLNTGCWVCRFDMRWATKVDFRILDRIIFDVPGNRYRAQTVPEDWCFSTLCNDLGLKIGCTRKVQLLHRGDLDFHNVEPWGTDKFDKEHVSESPVPSKSTNTLAESSAAIPLEV